MRRGANNKNTQTNLNTSWCVFGNHPVLSRANLPADLGRCNQAPPHSKSPNCLGTQLETSGCALQSKRCETHPITVGSHGKTPARRVVQYLLSLISVCLSFARFSYVAKDLMFNRVPHVFRRLCCPADLMNFESHVAS